MRLPEETRENLHEKHSWLKSFFRHRQHPIKIINYTSKNLWLLLIPLTKYLIATKFDFQEWIRTNWLDILAIIGIFAIAFFRWIFVFFDVDTDGIIVHSGLFGMFRTKVYYSEITTLSCCRNFILRAFKASTLYIETNAKVVSDIDIKLVLSKKSVDAIFAIVTMQTEGKVRKTIRSKKKHLFIFSLIFSSTLTGVIIFATFLFQLYRIIGNEMEQELLGIVNGEITRVNERYLSFMTRVPKTIQIIAFVVIGGWVLSFIANLLRHWDFKATRCGSQIIIESGLVTKRRHVLNRDKINYLDYEKSLLMKLFGICSVTVFCTGYGVRHREISALIPITTQREIRRSLKILVPDVPHSSIEVKTELSDVRRFLYIPVVMSFIPPVAGYVLKFLLPYWAAEINILTVIIMIPFVWKIIVSIAAAFSTSVGFRDGYCTLRYCRLYSFHKIIMPKENISKAVVMQTWPQRMTGRCNLKVYTKSQNKRTHIVKNLPLAATTELCRREGFDIKL